MILNILPLHFVHPWTVHTILKQLHVYLHKLLTSYLEFLRLLIKDWTINDTKNIRQRLKEQFNSLHYDLNWVFVDKPTLEQYNRTSSVSVKDRVIRLFLCMWVNVISATLHFGCGISNMVGPKKQDFWPRINVLTEDGSTEALLQILYGQYLILGVFGSCMF